MTSHYRQYVLTFIKWAVISKLRWKWKVLGQLLRTSLNIYHLGQNGMLKQQRLLQQILAEQMGYCIDNRRKTLINISRLIFGFLEYCRFSDKIVCSMYALGSTKIYIINHCACAIETLVQLYHFDIIFRRLQKPEAKFLNTFSNKYYHQNFLTSPQPKGTDTRSLEQAGEVKVHDVKTIFHQRIEKSLMLYKCEQYLSIAEFFHFGYVRLIQFEISIQLSMTTSKCLCLDLSTSFVSFMPAVKITSHIRR